MSGLGIQGLLVLENDVAYGPGPLQEPAIAKRPRVCSGSLRYSRKMIGVFYDGSPNSRPPRRRALRHPPPATARNPHRSEDARNGNR